MLQNTVIRIALLAAAALPIGAPSALADETPPPPLMPQTTFATAPKIAGATAAGDWTAWSEKSGSTWQLKVRSPAGEVSAPAIARRKIPFDASLGVRSNGAVVLAYSRCTRDPRYAAGGVVLAWYTARGCVLHFYDPVARKDRALGATDDSLADVLPQVSGSTLVYATIERRGRASIVQEALPRGGLRTLYTGPADRVNNDRVDVARGPGRIAIRNGHVAFFWYVVQGDAEFGQAFGNNLYVVDRGRAVKVDEEGGSTSGTCTGYTDFRALTVTSKYAIAELVSEVGWELVRVALRQPKRVREGHRPAAVEHAPGVDYGSGADVYLPWTALDGERLVLTAPATGGEQIGESPLPAFGAKARLDDPFQCGG